MNESMLFWKHDVSQHGVIVLRWTCIWGVDGSCCPVVSISEMTDLLEKSREARKRRR